MTWQENQLASAIKTVFGENLVTIMVIYIDGRGHNAWKEFTHLNPKANQLHNEIMMRDLQQKAIFRKNIITIQVNLGKLFTKI